MKRLIVLSLASFGLFTFGLPQKAELPRGLADFESPVRVSRDVTVSDPPEGHIRSLAEWEEAEAVMTLWQNESLLSAYTKHGKVTILTTSKGSWDSWLGNQGIDKSQVSYFTVKTDSIWIRDYGPWFILDGQGVFGMVGTIYNRPRPNDAKVPQFLAKELNLPLYETGLVHTGGNYYNDGQDNAFSSTLVYSENPGLAKEEVDGRMKSFLGIDRYTTARLAPKVTIEHIDTFGKLVAPDTWVFSEFPQGSQFRKDSEAYVTLLKSLRSPYGTPYKIHRMKMRLREGARGDRAEDYRAYINSFISNKALFYPSYGDDIDDEAKAVYQAALPGYEMVGVNNEQTSWGDSVHCRSRNLMKKNSVFLFPTLANGELSVEAFASPGARFDEAPVAHVDLDGETREVSLKAVDGNHFAARLGGKAGSTVRFYVTAKDSAGVEKVTPPGAPSQKIEYIQRDDLP